MPIFLYIDCLSLDGALQLGTLQHSLLPAVQRERGEGARDLARRQSHEVMRNLDVDNLRGRLRAVRVLRNDVNCATVRGPLPALLE